MKIFSNLLMVFFVLIIPKCNESAINLQIGEQLEKPVELNYPLSVKRFYAANENEPVWLQSEVKPDKIWSSMLLLDCVLQYGLSHDDYHPDRLLYPKLKELLDNPKKISAKDQANYEILLTDALITFINDLHFGKANPLLPRNLIDQGKITDFSAEDVLKSAFNAKDFKATILAVQPKSEEYIALQKYMKLIRGQYLDDCYTVPESDVRKVAINMERLKWNVVDAKNYISINIPSYSLTYHLPETSFTFKVIVGKSERQTPLLQSAITYIGTAPDWQVPNNMFKDILVKAIADPNFLTKGNYTIYNKNGDLITVNKSVLETIKKEPTGFFARQSGGCELTLGRMAFHFPNENGFYLYEAQQENLFNLTDRAISNGCVGIQNAAQLAKIMLQQDGQTAVVDDLMAAAKTYKVKNFILKKQIPLVIVYQTCAIKDGLLVTYPDPYQKDKELEVSLYKNEVMLAKRAQ